MIKQITAKKVFFIKILYSRFINTAHYFLIEQIMDYRLPSILNLYYRTDRRRLR